MRILHVLDHSPAAAQRLCLPHPRHRQGAAGAGLGGRLPDRAAPRAREGPDPEIVDGITFYRTPKPAPAPAPLGEWREIGALVRSGSTRWSSEWRPDQLHAHSPVLTALAALPVARRHGLPLVYEIRAFWEDAAVGNGTGREGSARYRLTRLLETHAARKADAVAVICEGLRDDLIRRGIEPDKIVVVAQRRRHGRCSARPPAADDALARQRSGSATPTRSASSAPSTIMRGWTI